MRYVALVLIVLFAGCSTKQYERKPKMVTLKTPQIKFADLGYLSSSNGGVQLELYVVGKALLGIEIDGMVCVRGEGCMTKSSFNDTYLYDAYPPDLLKNILLGKPIYNGEGVQRSDGEFSQTIKTPEVDIRYIVNRYQTYFKDRKNNILIKIKDTK